MGYHAPYSAAWMVDVTGIAGDDMDMAVHHGLAGSREIGCGTFLRQKNFVAVFFGFTMFYFRLAHPAATSRREEPVPYARRG